MKTNVYVDGFNLYYRCLKSTPHRWLDLAQLCRLILPRNTIHRIRYFTALVQPRPHDPTQPQRQQTYLRALATIPNLSIHYGTFLTSVKTAVLANPAPGQSRFVTIEHTEEKGSDVNLAAHLLCDAFDRDFEVAVVVSNDSDLVEPIKLVRARFGLPVGVLGPATKPSKELQQVATFYRQIRSGPLSASQFPPTLTDAAGSFTKPAGW